MTKANKHVEKINNGLVLVSYWTPVAAVVDGKVYKTNQRYSHTTTCHVNKFLAENSKGEVEEKDPSFFENLRYMR